MTFDADVLHLAVLTGRRSLGSGDRSSSCRAVERRHADPVGLSASGVDGAAARFTRAYRSRSSSRRAPGGLLYFWSAATSGVMPARSAHERAEAVSGRPDLRRLSHGLARRTLARDGLRQRDSPVLAVDRCPRRSRRRSIPREALYGGWSTYSPDGSMLLVADNGQLTLARRADRRDIGSDGKITLPPMTSRRTPTGRQMARRSRSRRRPAAE